MATDKNASTGLGFTDETGVDAAVPEASGTADSSNKSYAARFTFAVLASLICGVLSRIFFGPEWCNFLGAFFVAAGGFFLAWHTDRGSWAANQNGGALVAMGGVVIAVGALPFWPFSS